LSVCYCVVDMTEQNSTSEAVNEVDPKEVGAVFTAGLDTLQAESRRVSGIAALVAAEAKLSLQGFALTIAIGAFAAGIALMTWGLGMAFIATKLIEQGMTMSGVLLTMMIAHMGLLVAAAVVISRTAASIGFPRLRQLLGAK